MEAVKNGARKNRACEVLGINLRTVERWEHIPEDRRCGPKMMPTNALTPEERQKVLDIANSPKYANLPPCKIVPMLADEGTYVASVSSFIRILKKEDMLNHRGNTTPRTKSPIEELIAKGPNQVWSWDITYLKAAVKGTYYYLYLPMDIFSRMIVHWELHESESAELASEMIENAYRKNGVTDDQLTLHSDNGGPMKGATMLATLQRLGVTPSFSRPRVSDDNAFSESLFKTMKYCPAFPKRGFSSLDEAKAWVEKFVNWYNNKHLHSGINYVTPSSRHTGKDKDILLNRKKVFEKARKRNPSRWSKDIRDWTRQDYVELNVKPKNNLKKVA